MTRKLSITAILTALITVFCMLPGLANPVHIKHNYMSVDGTILGVARQTYSIGISPNTGAVANAATYRGMCFPGRAGVIKSIVVGCQTAPIGGTDTIKILKASSAGVTLLGTATLDATTLTNNSITRMTLTSTTADLTLTNLQGVYAEYVQGSTTTAAIGIRVEIEFQPTAQYDSTPQ